MSYERLSDEESRARVAAIIAAAESLATDEVRPAKVAAGGGAVGGIPGSSGYRRWAIGLGVGAVALAGFVIWKQSSRPVEADLTQTPTVLVASDLASATTVAGPDPTAPETTSPATTPGPGDTTPVSTGAPTESTSPVITETTAPPTTVASTVAPTTAAPTTAPPTPTTTPVEGPHLITDPAIESFTAVTDGFASIAGEVTDQALVDRIAQRVGEFLVVTTVENYLQTNPAAAAPIPLFVLLSDEVWNGDSATVKIEFGPQVVQMATALKARPSSVLSIYVHTDNHSSAEELIAQTLAQAQALKDILVAQGVAPDSIQIFGKGASQPVADESTPDGRLANRRVELVVSGLYD